MPILTKTLRAVAAVAIACGLSLAAGIAHADPTTSAQESESSGKADRYTGGLSPDGGTYTGEYRTGSPGQTQAPAGGTGNRGQTRPAAHSATFVPGPDTCGLVQTGAVQRCQCSSPTGPLILDYGVCETQPVTPASPQPPSQAAVLGAVRSASATLQLPDGVPVVAPDPANNEWDMIPIGYPIWLTTTAPAKAEASTIQDGISITITATRGTTVFAMGEPTQKVSNPYVSCTQMAQRKLKETPPDKKSPNCGYVYKVMGTYTIQATTTWKLTWTANQYSGTLYTTRTAPAAKPLTIGQLRAVIVADEP